MHLAPFFNRIKLVIFACKCLHSLILPALSHQCCPYCNPYCPSVPIFSLPSGNLYSWKLLMVKICKASRLCSFKSCLKTHLCCDACKLPKKGQAAGVLWSVLIMLIVCIKQWEWGIKHPSAAGPTLLQEPWGTLWLSLEVHVVSSLTPQSNGAIQPRCNTAWEFNFDQRIASLTGVEACHLYWIGESCRCPDAIHMLRIWYEVSKEICPLGLWVSHLCCYCST